MKETIEQKTAEAQIGMMKVFNIVLVVLVSLMTINALVGLVSTAGAVSKSEYEKGRKEDCKKFEKIDEKFEKIDEKMDLILKAVSITEGNVKTLFDRSNRVWNSTDG